jgi:hypothetical protein
MKRRPWTSGPTEAWKDPIDVLRYLAMAEIAHEGKFEIHNRRIGNGGY